MPEEKNGSLSIVYFQDGSNHLTNTSQREYSETVNARNCRTLENNV